MKSCIYCGAPLPDEANFCPNCGKTQAEARPEKAPRPWRRRLGVVLAVLALLGLCAAAVLLYRAPKDYVTQGSEILYSDKDGEYKIFLSWTGGAKTEREGVGERTVWLAEGEESMAPARLYVYDLSRDADIQQEFLEKVDTVTVEAKPRENSERVEVFQPAWKADFPMCAMVADILHNAFSGTNDIVWTLRMKNGDRISLQQQLTVQKQKSVVYTVDAWPMNTIEELQALLRHIEETESTDTVVSIYLPAVTYAGGLHYTERSYKLVGTTAGEQQTTFTGGFTVSLRKPQIAEFENICFAGSGSGTGISASEGVVLLDCRVTGWDIGAEAREGSWIAAFGTSFEDNGIGLQFNSTSASMSYPVYEIDSFRNNGVGVSLLRIPSTEGLSFPGCVFAGNGTDIENSSGRTVNTQDATFEPWTGER